MTGVNRRKGFVRIVSAVALACAVLNPTWAIAEEVPQDKTPEISAQAIRKIDLGDVYVELEGTGTYAYTGSAVTPEPYLYVSPWTWYTYYGVYGDKGAETYATEDDLKDKHDFARDPNFALVEGYGYIHPLVKGTDYTLTYTNNVQPGTASITATGIGDGFMGTSSLSFNITKSGQSSAKAVRLSGNNRYDTMAAIVNKAFAPDRTMRVAVLASGANFPDALSAAALAGSSLAPILTTDPNTLSEQALIQLKRLNVAKVYIMGGEAAVSANVEQTLVAQGYQTQRVSGADRVETAIRALEAASSDGANSDTVIVATGYNFADSLSISPFSYMTRSPILLTQANGMLSDATVAAIRAHAHIRKAVIVGGPAAVSNAVEGQLKALGISGVRIEGADRYETSKRIADFESAAGDWFNYVEPVVTTGKAFPDALAGAPFAANSGRVVLLVDHEGDATVRAMGEHKFDVGARYYVLGGTNAVSNELVAYIDSLIL